MNGNNTVQETYSRLENELNEFASQLSSLKSVMEETNKQTKKQYIELDRLEAMFDQIMVVMSEIKENNKVTDKMSKVDLKHDKTVDKIENVEMKIDKSRFKFINDFNKNRLERLKNKKAKIEAKQRKLVDSYLKKTYKEFYKYARIEGTFTGKDRYYKEHAKEAELKEQKFNSRIYDDEKLLHKIPNAYNKLRALPHSIAKERFNSLRNKNAIYYDSRHSKKMDLVMMRDKIKKLHELESNNIGFTPQMFEGNDFDINMEFTPQIVQQDVQMEDENDNIIDFQSRKEEMENRRAYK